jgi:hypothetical protein
MLYEEFFCSFDTHPKKFNGHTPLGRDLLVTAPLPEYLNPASSLVGSGLKS